MWLRRSAALALYLSAATYSSIAPPPLQGQESILLTRQEARALALESGPRFQAVKAMGEAARGAARTDRTYPFNPTAEIKGVEAVDPGGWGDYEAVSPRRSSGQANGW